MCVAQSVKVHWWPLSRRARDPVPVPKLKLPIFYDMASESGVGGCKGASELAALPVERGVTKPNAMR